MIKLVYPTSARKLGCIAATYRAGITSKWKTCPDSCPLKPAGCDGADKPDPEYLAAVRAAVPRKGQAWTYSHFHHTQFPPPKTGTTTINISCDSVEEAIEAHQAGHPAVVALPEHNAPHLPMHLNGIPIIRCPAETDKSIQCSNCGHGRPLCARINRKYIVAFIAHGSKKALVGNSQLGGCYGTAGPVGLQWLATSTGEGNTTQSNEHLVHWATQVLPPGTLLRHHIVGDFGPSTAAPPTAP